MSKTASPADAKKVIRRGKTPSKRLERTMLTTAERGLIALVEPLDVDMLRALRRHLASQSDKNKTSASAAGTRRYGARTGLVFRDYKRR